MSTKNGKDAMPKEAGSLELLERYLQAVRMLLPKRQRDDVARELEEDLRSEIEEKEAEQGRKLEERELADLLHRFGHPALLALKYQQGGYLIGPAVFPLYKLALRAVLGILAVVHILVPGIYLVLTGEPAGRVVGLFVRFPGVALPVLAFITFGSAVLETKVVRSAIEESLSSWRPQSLPPLVKEEPARPASIAAFVMSFLVSVWWLVGLRFPTLILGPAADYLAFGPIFYRLYVPMAVAMGGGLVLAWLRLARPQDTRLVFTSGLFLEAFGLVVLYLLARGDGGFLVGREALVRVPGHAGVLELANLAMAIGLGIAFVVSGLASAWKYFGRPRGWARSGRPSPPRAS
jgi:hypothetical protein